MFFGNRLLDLLEHLLQLTEPGLISLPLLLDRGSLESALNIEFTTPGAPVC